MIILQSAIIYGIIQNKNLVFSLFCLLSHVPLKSVPDVCCLCFGERLLQYYLELVHYVFQKSGEDW